MSRPPHMQPTLTKIELLNRVRRWTRARKSKLCHGIHLGIITSIEAREAHNISAQELNNWYSAYRAGNTKVLGATYSPRSGVLA